jgi:transcriptional regulator with XRE-family HTH domain
MNTNFSIADLRKELKLTLVKMAVLCRVPSKGRMSDLENGNANCTAEQALAIELLSVGEDGRARIDAAALNATVAAVRATNPASGSGGGSVVVELPLAEPAGVLDPDMRVLDRIVMCQLCEPRLDDPVVRGCSAPECPHAERVTELVSPTRRDPQRLKAAA